MRTLVAALFVALPLPAAPVPKAIRTAPPSADGVWEWVEWNADGRSDDVPADRRYWKIEGDRMSNGQGTVKEASRPIGELRPFTLRIDDPARPTLRTMIVDGKTYSAVFELDGDMLRWAFSSDGPVTECKPGLGVSYYLFQRVKE